MRRLCIHIYLSSTADLHSVLTKGVSVYCPTYFLGMVGDHADTTTVHGGHTHSVSAPLEDVGNGLGRCRVVCCGDVPQPTPGSLAVEDNVLFHWGHDLRINL